MASAASAPAGLIENTPVVEFGSDLGSDDIVQILASQLQVLQRLMTENVRASAVASAMVRSSSALEAETSELQIENQRLRTQLANAGLTPDAAGYGSGETGSTMELAQQWKADASKVASSGGVQTEQRLPATTWSAAQQQEPKVPMTLPGSIGDENEGKIFQEMAQAGPQPPPAPVSQPAAAPSPQELAPILPVADTVAPSQVLQLPKMWKDIEDDACRRSKLPDSETLAFLSKVQLFKRLPEEHHSDLAAACVDASYTKGEPIIRQGESGNEFFVIVHGRVSVSIDGKTVAMLAAGDFFGELSLLRDEPRIATITAETSVNTLKISRAKFKELELDQKLIFPPRQTAGKHHQAVFADAAAMKEKLRMAMAKPPYDVRNYYHEKGIAQRIARSSPFEHITLGIIAFNAIWISVDTDHNTADILLNAHPVFQVAEHFFCAYFSLEWLTRFLAFRWKRDGLRDAWFCFDTTLVFMMVGETWIMTLVVLAMGGGSSGGLGDASILRLFRLLRLSRMARMARLLRAMPELMVLIKGMSVAMRSVFFTLLLLAGIIYLFAIAFVQLMRETKAGEEYFGSVPEAMNSLLLDAVLPDEAEIIEAVGADGWVYKTLLLIYILLASLTVMNMLVGVLCEVVSVVSSVEKESLLVNYVKGTLLHMLETSGLDADGDHLIAKPEFEALLENPAAAKALQEVGVDVIGLVDFTDFIFKDGRELSFPDFMEMVLQLRGSNIATVKDMVDLRKIILTELEKYGEQQKEVEALARSCRDSIDESITRLREQDSANMAAFAATKGPVSQPVTRSVNGAPIWQASGPQPPAKMAIGASFPGDPLASLPLVPVSQEVRPDLRGVNWAAAAACRLTAAATELSAAAGELASRNRVAAKLAEE